MPETTLAPPPDAKLASEDYSWLQPEPETPARKMSRKVQANPLVPIGEFTSECERGVWLSTMAMAHAWGLIHNIYTVLCIILVMSLQGVA